MGDPTMPAPRAPRGAGEAELRALSRIAFWRRVGVVAAALGLVLALAGIGYTVYSIRNTQVDNTARAKSTNAAAKAAKAASDRIEDCTTPGRDCYERGQGQITSAVVDVNRVTVVAAGCADQDGQQTPQEIRACIIRGLKDPSTTVPRTAAPGTVTAPSTPSPRPSSAAGTPQSKPSSTPKPTPTSAPSTSPTGSAPSPTPSFPSPTAHVLCLEPLANLCVL